MHLNGFVRVLAGQALIEAWSGGYEIADREGLIQAADLGFAEPKSEFGAIYLKEPQGPESFHLDCCSALNYFKRSLAMILLRLGLAKSDVVILPKLTTIETDQI